MTVRADRNDLAGMISPFVSQRRNVVTFQVGTTLVILKRRLCLAELARPLRPFESIVLKGALATHRCFASGITAKGG
jgi:hypothetical protein